jgi:hypothetical protein
MEAFLGASAGLVRSGQRQSVAASVYPHLALPLVVAAAEEQGHPFFTQQVRLSNERRQPGSGGRGEGGGGEL